MKNLKNNSPCPLKIPTLPCTCKRKGGVGIVDIDDVEINKKDPTPARSRTRGWVDVDFKKGHPSSQSHVGIVTGCCTRPGTAAGYSRVRVRVGFIQPWPYPYPQPGVCGAVAGRHVQTPREKPVNGQPKRCQTHRICRYVFLFVSYIFTNHAGSRRPTTANEGQRRSTKAHSSQRRPTKANAAQRRPPQAHEVPQQPTTANEGHRSVFFSFLILYSYYYETVPTPPLACKYEPGGGFTHHHQLGIVTGCSTRPGTAAGYSRVRVRVGFLQPGPYPYPQPGVGGSAHTFKLRAKSTQTTPDASFGPYVGMFSSFFFVFFSKLTHSL